jgi:hypothetical protein
VRSELDLVVPPLRSAVVAVDQAHPVQPPEVAIHKRVARPSRRRRRPSARDARPAGYAKSVHAATLYSRSSPPSRSRRSMPAVDGRTRRSFAAVGAGGARCSERCGLWLLERHEDRGMESLCPAPGLASWVVPGQGLLGEARLGRPLLSLWAASPLFVVGRPCDCPGVPRARIRSCRFARLVSAFERLGGG